MGDELNTRPFLSDKQQFRHVFDRYYPALLNFALGFVHDHQKAEDIVQDVFVKLWERANGFTSEHSVRSFLYTSVKNQCFNELEHEKVVHKHKDAVINEAWNESAIDHMIMEEELHRLISCAINELPPDCRYILQLSIRGLKNKEIAEDLNISVNTVKTQKKIAYKQLRIRLKDVYLMAGLLIKGIV